MLLVLLIGHIFVRIVFVPGNVDQVWLLNKSVSDCGLLNRVFNLCKPKEGGRLFWLSILVLLLIIFGLLFLFPVNHLSVSLLYRFLIFLRRSVDELQHLLGLPSLGPSDLPEGLHGVDELLVADPLPSEVAIFVLKTQIHHLRLKF